MRDWGLVLGGFGVAWLFYILPRWLDDRRKERIRLQRLSGFRSLGYADGLDGQHLQEREQETGETLVGAEAAAYLDGWSVGIKQHKATA